MASAVDKLRRCPWKPSLVIYDLDDNSLALKKINLQFSVDTVIELLLYQYRQITKNKLLVIIMSGVIQSHAQLDFRAAATACSDLFNARIGRIKIFSKFLEFLNGSWCDFHTISVINPVRYGR